MKKWIQDKIDEHKRYDIHKIKPEVKEDWLAALRSGEYTQGKDFLCRANGSMCCLGVLRDTIDEGDWYFDEEENAWRSTARKRDDLDYDNGLTMPTSKTYKAAGLNEDTANMLARLNDDGATFEDIAEVIEVHL